MREGNSYVFSGFERLNAGYLNVGRIRLYSSSGSLFLFVSFWFVVFLPFLWHRLNFKSSPKLSLPVPQQSCCSPSPAPSAAPAACSIHNSSSSSSTCLDQLGQGSHDNDTPLRIWWPAEGQHKQRATGTKATRQPILPASLPLHPLWMALCESLLPLPRPHRTTRLPGGSLPGYSWTQAKLRYIEVQMES